MDFKNIKKFIELAKEEGVLELKYETKEVKISVNLASSSSAIMPMQVNQAHLSKVVESEASYEKNANASVSRYHEITSPFVGTFYAASAPEKPNFVNVGDKVSKGQTLCILEAMKIMNEIECDVNGEIVEICVDNESLVEFGQTLFRVRV